MSCRITCYGMLGLVVFLSNRSSAQVAPQPRTVTVSAEAEVEAVPDEVILSMAVETRDKNLIAAKKMNDDRVAAVLREAKKRGIEEPSIKMHTINIEPQYRKDYTEFLGYEVQRGVEVSMFDLALLEPLLSDCLNAGVNRVDSVLFRTRKNRELQVQARSRAVEYAKEKAAHLAELNGLKLGKAMEISEGVEHNVHAALFRSYNRSAAITPRRPESLSPATQESVLLASSRDVKPVDSQKLRIIPASLAMAADPTGKSSPNPRTDAPVSLVAPGVITVSAEVRIVFELLDPEKQK
jgi:uncharacterized protein